ncbi:PREDICTED: EKC/KEOPS complex subunit LAGE3-like [Elephantulus edwardii]|uniref:EKC/KEOPS complex subunit LAGE3-like n=1 Tax=Elephantulus edwardii TaxID=28737 RepID=UPI0003F08C17|nr:PREDICTED: EKC/KEOPS complex subunit LAGE3-like [Elephantulus edwardii]
MTQLKKPHPGGPIILFVAELWVEVEVCSDPRAQARPKAQPAAMQAAGGDPGGAGAEDPAGLEPQGSPEEQGGHTTSGGGSGGAVRPLFKFSLTVPFHSPLEVEMACRALTPIVQNHRGVIKSSYSLKGSTLALRWTAENPVLLQASINHLFRYLYVVIRNIVTMRPHFPQNRHRPEA